MYLRFVARVPTYISILTSWLAIFRLDAISDPLVTDAVEAHAILVLPLNPLSAIKRRQIIR